MHSSIIINYWFLLSVIVLWLNWASAHEVNQSFNSFFFISIIEEWVVISFLNSSIFYLAIDVSAYNYAIDVANLLFANSNLVLK